MLDSRGPNMQNSDATLATQQASKDAKALKEGTAQEVKLENDKK
ncbi:MAG: hypothetical protein Q7R81_05120 [Candidatus Peregrinibacteria bacterium]|nr:hypothetical protein [Candidatus Peregrinibacteria bacterium]